MATEYNAPLCSVCKEAHADARLLRCHGKFYHEACAIGKKCCQREATTNHLGDLGPALTRVVKSRGDGDALVVTRVPITPPDGVTVVPDWAAAAAHVAMSGAIRVIAINTPVNRCDLHGNACSLGGLEVSYATLCYRHA